jgi:hypothetical protein
MKEVPNKLVDIPGNTAKDFKGLLIQCLDFVPQGGFDPSTLRARARVEKAIEKAKPGGTLVFEDADFGTAQAAVRSVRWAGRHHFFIELADAFSV